MGCHTCGRRQVDPESGPSTWRRAVVHGEQVLVCPDCQVEGWTDGLDGCASCGSTMLAKRLGEITCRACGASVLPREAEGDAVRAPEGGGDPAGISPAREDLRREVADALDRLLGRD